MPTNWDLPSSHLIIQLPDHRRPPTQHEARITIPLYNLIILRTRQLPTNIEPLPNINSHPIQIHSIILPKMHIRRIERRALNRSPALHRNTLRLSIHQHHLRIRPIRRHATRIIWQSSKRTISLLTDNRAVQHNITVYALWGSGPGHSASSTNDSAAIPEHGAVAEDRVAVAPERRVGDVSGAVGC